MTKKKKVRKQRVQSACVKECRTKTTSFWNPLPYDKKSKEILSCVDCIFNKEYYQREDAIDMLRSL
jgi:hypothetical protein